MLDALSKARDNSRYGNLFSCTFVGMKVNRSLYIFAQLLSWVLGVGLLLGFKQPTISGDAATPPGQSPATQKVQPADPASISSDLITDPAVTDTTATAADSTALVLPKPAPLELIPAIDPDPLPGLDPLIAKQPVKMAPYVPLVQEVWIGLDYGKLVMNGYQAVRKLQDPQRDQEQQYEGSMGILFRKNIQVSSNLGYAHLHPTHTSDNQQKYAVKGIYGRLGVEYVIKYGAYDNLYVGLHYGQSYFTNYTKPETAARKVIRKNLTGSWFGLDLGAETQPWKAYRLYLGLAFHLAQLYHFTEFKPAQNYVIPGYGRNKNKLNAGLSLYIQYRFSFLERIITLN